MFPSMFDTSHVAEVALRTAVIYCGLLAALRLAGKREVGQMKPFDLVTLLILSNAVQNAMVGPDTSLLGGLVAAGVILAFNYVIGLVRERSRLATAVFEGEPALLIHDGQFIKEHLRAEHLSEDDVLQAMREHGVQELSQVKDAVLEVDGAISVIPKEDTKVTRTQRRFRRFHHN
jgi:uncharacterized membrane protein YcaP (DUF421 family)